MKCAVRKHEVLESPKSLFINVNTQMINSNLLSVCIWSHYCCIELVELVL